MFRIALYALTAGCTLALVILLVSILKHGDPSGRTIAAPKQLELRSPQPEQGATVESKHEAAPTNSSLVQQRETPEESDLYDPKVISFREGNKTHVATQRIQLFDTSQLFLSLGFIILDSDDPDAAALNGIAGFVVLEEVGDSQSPEFDMAHRLSRQTKLAIARGKLPAWLFSSPRVDQTQFVTRLAFADFVPLNLLYYLREEGEISVELEGRECVLDEKWAQHLRETVEETLREHQRQGYSPVRKGTSASNGSSASSTSDSNDRRASPGLDSGSKNSTTQATPHDEAWLSDFSRTTSRKYAESGFDGFHFGDTPNEVLEKLPVVEGRKPTLHDSGNGFLSDLLSNRKFHFDEQQQLRAIVTEYGIEEVGRAARSLARLFGVAHNDDVFHMSGRTTIDNAPLEREDTYYCFPESLACVTEISTISVSTSSYLGTTHRSFHPEHRLFVSIYDRNWLLSRIRSYGDGLIAQLRWIRTHIPSRSTNIAALPPIAGVRPVVSPLGDRCELKTNLTGTISEAAFYGTKEQAYLIAEKFSHDLPLELDAPESGSLLVHLNLNLLPGEYSPVVFHGGLAHLRCRLQARLAAMAFVPVDGEVLQGKHRERGDEYYSWETEDGWRIEVGSDYLTAEN